MIRGVVVALIVEALVLALLALAALLVRAITSWWLLLLFLWVLALAQRK